MIQKVNLTGGGSVHRMNEGFLFPSGELVTTPLFDGDQSYIAYPPLTNVHDDLRVELEFKPLERDGLMFFCGGKKMKVEDFVSISMVEGRVEFRYELGTGNGSRDHAGDTARWRCR